jgi:excisionase family DNA binding protein
MRKSSSDVVSLPILPNTNLPLPGYQPWFSGSPGWYLAAFQAPTQLEYFYDIKGAAKLVNASEKTIHRAIRNGELKSGSVKKLVRIRFEDLLDFMGF